jgi:hypothetical protein
VNRSGSSARRALLGIALLALLWALAIRITGGIAINTQWGLISSRAAVRPLLAGVLLLACYATVGRRHWREDIGPLAHPGAWPPLIATLSTAVALIVGIGWGTRIAAGPDQSGYVSEAAMFARGELTVEAPSWSENAPWNDAAYTASPVGWQPTRQTHFLAPTYSPGLPMILALAQKAAGQDAVFYVVPLLGTLLVWTTYILGSTLAGPWVGAIGAALLVSSPTFLLMQQQVMSDVPSAAFWTLSLTAALHGRYPWLAGTAAGLAVLTRPNLAPLAAVPLMLITRRERLLYRVASFAVPLGIACAIVGALNWRYYGSPLMSGYGPLSGYYSFDHIAPNVRLYGRWLFELHTPLVALSIAAVFLARSNRQRIALVTLGIPLALLANYIPFLVFHPNDWGYTRFLLPGYPAWFVGLGVTAMSAIERARRSRAAIAAVAIIITAIASYGWVVALNTGVFMQRQGDARYKRAVDYAAGLPFRSILLANAHSGTLRFYTGREVLRFEAIRPPELDTLVQYLRRNGYALFLIGDEFEIDQFRTMFSDSRTVATMTKEPRKSLAGVDVYDIH